MSGPNAYAILRYSGANPGADANTYVLFSTVTGLGGAQALTAQVGVHRVRVDVYCTNAVGCTFKLSKSRDKGVTWRLVTTSSALGAGTTGQFDEPVEGFYDWKVEWVNNSNAQTAFEADIALVDSRNPTT